MAVQIPDPGTGNGQTGDNEYVFRKKVKDNFSDQTNAASRLVGASKGSVPLAEQAHKAVFSHIDAIYTSAGVDCDTFAQGTVYSVTITGNTNAPPFPSSSSYWLIRTMASLNANTTVQVAIGYTSGDIATRIRIGSAYTAWKSPASLGAYENTTAAGANTVVDSTGKLMRSTSIAYTNTNTTKDSNGFIKAASPIVKVFADKVELNGEAVDQDVNYKKNGVGDYTITTVSGLSTDGWYIELPKDMNGNPKLAVTLSEVDGVISLKTYKRIFSMETFTFEPDLDNPLDIPDTRWIDLRLNEIPVENLDDTQMEV